LPSTPVRESRRERSVVRTVPLSEAWDAEWAAEKAAEALRYLGTHYPECLDTLRVLDEHEQAAHEAAVRGDREGYLEALRSYMKAGRHAALEIRGRAA
jgi:hypothetical protein